MICNNCIYSSFLSQFVHRSHYSLSNCAILNSLTIFGTLFDGSYRGRCRNRDRSSITVFFDTDTDTDSEVKTGALYYETVNNSYFGIIIKPVLFKSSFDLENNFLNLLRRRLKCNKPLLL